MKKFKQAEIKINIANIQLITPKINKNFSAPNKFSSSFLVVFSPHSVEKREAENFTISATVEKKVSDKFQIFN